MALDSNRAWCPRADCETICHVCDPSEAGDQPSAQCPSCAKEFCARCSGNLHPGETCQEYGQKLVRLNRNGGGGASGVGASSGFFDIGKFDDIKPCPMCNIPIERDAGCAQMMCKRCKHVFCWYCQTSLDVSWSRKKIRMAYLVIVNNVAVEFLSVSLYEKPFFMFFF